MADFYGTPTTITAGQSVSFFDQSTGTGPFTWDWDFGDGGSSTQQSPPHTYTTAGTYTVRLTVTGPGGLNTATKTNYITVNPAPVAPVAAFYGTPTIITAGQSVSFFDQSTGTGPFTYAWDFQNDGVVDSTLQSPSFTYTSAGTYTVKLTVTGPGGSNSATKTGYITVNPAPVAPVAAFYGTPTTITAGQSVSFFDQSTGTGPFTYAWDFQNDGVVDSTLQNPSFTYTSAGTYTVKLTVTGPGGSNSATKTGYITVNPAVVPPVAAFYGTPLIGTGSLAVSFTDQSTGTGPLTYAWDFQNDGVVDSTLQNPSFTYTSAGTYTVKLTVTGPGGSNSATKTSYITVNPGLTANFHTDTTVGNAPMTVTFTDWSTGSPTAWSWSFGDGGTDTVQNPVHVYQTQGLYDVTLTASKVVDGNIITDTKIMAGYISVKPTKPFASMSVSPGNTGEMPFTVSLCDYSEGYVDYADWTFGDGSPEEDHYYNNWQSVDSCTEHTFFNPGTYTVTLEVGNYWGDWDSTTQDITVTRASVSKIVMMPGDSMIELGSNKPQYINVMLILSPADEQRGFSGYTIDLTTASEESHGQSEFTSISFPDWAVVKDVNPPKPSSGPMAPTPVLSLKAVDLNNMVQPGQWMIPLAVTSVNGMHPGYVKINANVLKLNDEGGNDFTEGVQVIPGWVWVYANVQPFWFVEDTSGVYHWPDYIYGVPTDPNNDLLFEDVNGNGQMDYADVVLYFQNMEQIPKFEPVAFFDYNQNGRIDFADVIELFHEE